ncbi:hypothetical protein PC116_g14171 [Phytophthora cactorum]|nr:hypothetical protein C6341_g11903 [Phytophthora cactorum]KAG4237784.1 hypothetical protein PC116_g14171 [Phytophthora cactorum]
MSSSSLSARSALHDPTTAPPDPATSESAAAPVPASLLRPAPGNLRGLTIGIAGTSISPANHSAVTSTSPCHIAKRKQAAAALTEACQQKKRLVLDKEAAAAAAARVAAVPLAPQMVTAATPTRRLVQAAVATRRPRRVETRSEAGTAPRAPPALAGPRTSPSAHNRRHPCATSL